MGVGFCRHYQVGTNVLLHWLLHHGLIDFNTITRAITLCWPLYSLIWQKIDWNWRNSQIQTILGPTTSMTVGETFRKTFDKMDFTSVAANAFTTAVLWAIIYSGEYLPHYFIPFVRICLLVLFKLVSFPQSIWTWFIGFVRSLDYICH